MITAQASFETTLGVFLKAIDENCPSMIPEEPGQTIGGLERPLSASMRVDGMVGNVLFSFPPPEPRRAEPPRSRRNKPGSASASECHSDLA
jgi:hypothetical protein